MKNLVIQNWVNKPQSVHNSHQYMLLKSALSKSTYLECKKLRPKSRNYYYAKQGLALKSTYMLTQQNGILTKQQSFLHFTPKSDCF